MAKAIKRKEGSLRKMLTHLLVVLALLALSTIAMAQARGAPITDSNHFKCATLLSIDSGGITAFQYAVITASSASVLESMANPTATPFDGVDEAVPAMVNDINGDVDTARATTSVPNLNDGTPYMVYADGKAANNLRPKAYDLDTSPAKAAPATRASPKPELALLR